MRENLERRSSAIEEVIKANSFRDESVRRQNARQKTLYVTDSSISP
jgi:hypothetical protein